MTKDFLWRLKLHVCNWNEWPLVLSTWFSVLSGGRSGWRQWLDRQHHAMWCSARLAVCVFECHCIGCWLFQCSLHYVGVTHVNTYLRELTYKPTSLPSVWTDLQTNQPAICVNWPTNQPACHLCELTYKPTSLPSPVILCWQTVGI